jgi:uncharacterized protein (DUF885 family)
MKNIFTLLFVTILNCTSFAQLVQTSELHDLMVHFEADRGSLSRFYFLSGSPERRERLHSFYQEYYEKLTQINFSQISQAGKVDYILFMHKIERQIELIREERTYHQALTLYVEHLKPIYDIEQKRRRGYKLDASQVAATYDKISSRLKDLMKNQAHLPGLSAYEGLVMQDVIRGHRAALKSISDFYYGYDPLFTWWVPKPQESLEATLQNYAGFIQTKVVGLPKDDGSGIIGNPIGKDAIIKELRAELIPYNPEDLIQIAEKQFAWCEQQMLQASREMGYGNDWKAALESVKTRYVPEGMQPEAMLDLYHQSINFLKENDLITIPPLAEETWRMSMMSAEQQKVSPFFLGGELFQIAYPTPEMDHPDKMMSMRGNNPHFSRATVHHELIAGHHLQQYMNSRYKAYRNFRTPFWTEGWALYWEMVLWDLDFPRNAEDRVGMLFWRMHRCARIIFSLNYHMGQWTPQQCIDFLVDKVGHERANAEGEVRRSFTGRYGPLYQLAYMIGALQFYELKDELVGSGKMTYKQYHDAVMQENSMPVEMLRALLLDLPLTPEYKTQWKF